MVQRRAARYTCNRYHNTSSVIEMLRTLNCPTLEKMQIRTRIIFLYKIIHHLVVIYPTNLLIQSDPRTRQYPHSYSYRLIQTNTDSYKYSFFPRTITQWNLLPVAAVQCTTLDSFREQKMGGFSRRPIDSLTARWSDGSIVRQFDCPTARVR